MRPVIHVAAGPGEAHVAVVSGERLIDYVLWRRGAPDGVGDVHRGRVRAAARAMGGVFVALADAEGFLPDSEGGKGLTAGTILTVRVTRSAQGGKGPRLAAVAGEAGPVGLLQRGPNPVQRLSSRYPGAPVLVDDAALAAGLRSVLGERTRLSAEAMPEAAAEEIEGLGRPSATLADGARLAFWPTPALVAIDVDAGANVARGEHGALNRAVLPALARQIRLRNLSGAIVVDLAGLSVRRRARLGPDFAAALAEDALAPKFLGFTALGLAEIVRPRVHPPLHELLAQPLGAGLAGLRAVLAAWQPGGALPALRAHPTVVSALRVDPVALPDVRRRTGMEMQLTSDPALAPATWVLETTNG